MLKNRVLAGWIIAFTIGVGIGLYTDGKIRVLLFALIGVLCGLALAAHRFHIQQKKVYIIGIIILCGMTYSSAYTSFVFTGSGCYDDVADEVVAKVEDIGCYAEGGYLDISITESNLGVEKGTGVRFYYNGTLTDAANKEISIVRGDSVSCTITYHKHDSNSLYAKNIALTAVGTMNSLTMGEGFFYQLRERSESEIDSMFEGFPDEVAAIAKTLVIGETTETDSYVYEMYRNAGISHLLVISGLQITLIVMSLFSLLEFLTVPKKVRSVLCLFVLLGYAFFIGFTPSVSRAAIMTGIMLLCMLVTRRADSITSLFLALFVLLLWNPYNIFSVGLGLSFLSCLAILIISPYLSRPISGKAIKLKKTVRFLLTPLLFSLAATIFTFPVIFTTFDSISYISPLTNLFITPLYTYLLIFLIPCILLFSIIQSGAILFSYIPGKIIEYSYHLLEKLYEADIGSFSSSIPYMIIPLLFAVAIILTFCLLRRRKMFIAVGILSLCFLTSIALCIANFKEQCENTTITALHDSFAYQSLFIADSGESMYIELGGKRSDISTVYQHGYCRLDYYVMDGITKAKIILLENALAEVNIATVYVPMPQSDEKELYNQIKVLAKRRNCVIIEYGFYTSFRVGNSSVTIRSGSDILSESFVATVKTNRKSIRIYGGTAINSYPSQSTESGYSDVVIMMNSFDSANIYEGILCKYRCIKSTEENALPDSRVGIETIFDYTESSSVLITMNEETVEVNLDEP